MFSSRMQDRRFYKKFISIIFLKALVLFSSFIYLNLETIIKKHLSLSQYIVLHTFLEIICIVITFSAASVVYHSYKNIPGFIRPLGAMFLSVGLIDILHTLTFPGMPVPYLSYSIDYSVVFWVLARFIGSIVFIVSGILLVTSKTFSLSRWKAYGVSLTIALSFICFTFILPQGIQEILNINHLLILDSVSIVFFIIAIVLFLWGIKRTGYVSAYLLLFGIVFLVFRNIIYLDVVPGCIDYGVTSAMFKLAAYIFIYLALVRQFILWPYKQINYLLTESAQAIARALESKDDYTFHHSERVAEYAFQIAKVMNYDQDFQEKIRLSGLLHDVGKIGISDAVLNKPGRLKDIDWVSIKSHPKNGYNILANISEPIILQGIIDHHERIDGKGYPEGKEGENISLAGRIIGVADTFDALTSDRPYRAGKSKKEALQILKEVAGTQLDPKIVGAFLELDKLNKIESIMSLV